MLSMYVLKPIWVRQYMWILTCVRGYQLCLRMRVFACMVCTSLFDGAASPQPPSPNYEVGIQTYIYSSVSGEFRLPTPSSVFVFTQTIYVWFYIFSLLMLYLIPFHSIVCCIWSLMFCTRHKRRVTASLPSYLSEKYTFVILLAFLSSSGTYQYLINADSTWPAAPAMSLNGQKKRSIERQCWLKVGAGPCKNELIYFHITYAASLFFHFTVFLLRLLL